MLLLIVFFFFHDNVVDHWAISTSGPQHNLTEFTTLQYTTELYTALQYTTELYTTLQYTTLQLGGVLQGCVQFG